MSMSKSSRHIFNVFLSAAVLWSVQLVLLTGGLIYAPSAQARDPVVCSANMGGGVFDFGSYDPISGSPTNTSNVLSISCVNYTGSNFYVSVCFNISDGPSVQNGYRQLLGPSNTALNYQLYQDAAHTQIWGSVDSTNFPNPYYVEFYLRRHRSYSQNIPIYGQIMPSQVTAVPGTYLASFANPTLRITGLLGYYGYPGISGCSGAGSDAGNFNSFNVQATVNSSCQVNAAPLNFGTVAGLFTSVAGTTSVSLQCVKGTNYTLTLNNGLHAAGGNRYMSDGVQQVQYGLFQDPGFTQPWSPTNNQSGAGTGLIQNISVYGFVPAQPTIKANTYTDTISVNVTY